MLNLNGSNVLITGGTGSFGKKFIQILLDRFPDIKKVVVFSRDEYKQYEMSRQFSGKKYKAIQYIIGDIRDRDRLTRAFEGMDYVIHAAALKQVPSAEYNPMEFIKTNILGSENVIEAALSANVKKVVCLSTDKASSPVSLYGATKLCADKLFVAANYLNGNRDTRFSVVRYGNVIGSRGSVVPLFLEEKSKGVIPITDPEMTRFNVSLDEEADIVLLALSKAWGGELFVPKLASFKISDLAEAIAPECKIEVVGLRPAEKIHEDLITEADSVNTVEFENYFVILPSIPLWDVEKWREEFKGKSVPTGFQYNSAVNERWLSVEDLRHQINKYVDPNF